ncbi:MAG: sapC family protein [Alphaproteobacteria bacterium CG_4_9_14_3_um_filter_47_13]|nr:MAG: sapC family protein [Alphaproteobacteria bacterium CG_4_9_14_3_um_filter_47_13]
MAQDIQKQPAGNMPLFYTKPAPLDAKKHANLGLQKNFGMGFTKSVNAVPINMIEMPQICHFYPIAFSPDQNATPVALIGLRDNENLFLNEKGEWEPNSYIPAYIRRYPFIFSEMPDSDQLTLCVDMADNIVNENGDQKFFEKDGKPSQLAQNALEFCKSYHAAAQQTLEFSRVLGTSGLLVERQAEINIGEGKKINFSGFRIIDEQKLSELDDADFMEWRRKGWLPFLYAHLFSGAQWQRLTLLLNKRLAAEGKNGKGK